MPSRFETRLACRLLALLLVSTVASAAAQEIPLLAPTSDRAVVALPEVEHAVPRPSDFLGYPLGSRFTHHHRILDYFEALAEASPRVRLGSYGETYEGRPLMLATITSPRLHERIETLRQENLRLGGALGGLPAGEAIADQPVVVWLAYGVHGNESSSAEAAMATAWALAAAGGELGAHLEHTVVILDPLANPDGRERYVGWYETQRGVLPDADAAAAEHWEPWPGGRQNHYLVDLNRDWAWLSQRETRDRVAAYRRWEPQVYVDFHEMSPRSSYFFPPPADPVHPDLDRGVIGWLDVFGRANAGAFDRLGWTYYVGEVFDLFYPAYGDTYPGLRGAVGMTYEVAGGGSAGQAVELPGGRLLTLADRIARHVTTGLTTVRTAAENRRAILASFVAARRPPAAVETYLWPADQPEARTLADLLSLHGIAVGVLPRPASLEVSTLGGETSTRQLPAGTWAASTDQPLGRLLRAMMEPDTAIPVDFVDEQRRRIADRREPEFYDVTAWSLPLAFNLDAVRLAGLPPGLAPPPPAAGGVSGEGEVGFLLAPQGIAGYGVVAALLAEETRLRVAGDRFRLGGRELPAGTVFVPRRGNPEELPERLAALAAERGVEVTRVASSLTEEGPALGSERLLAVDSPEIALLGGEGISPTSFGFAWHLLDRQVGADVTRLDTATLAQVELRDFDVLVLPDGDGYGDAMDEDGAERLAEWVHAGGVAVAIGGAGEWLRELELSAVEAWEPAGGDVDIDVDAGDGDGDEGDESGDRDDGVEEGSAEADGDVDLASRELLTPGAIVRSEIVRDDLLVAGLPSSPPVLFYGSTVLRSTGKRDVDVLRVADDPDPVTGGFAWPEARERLRGALLVSSEPAGRGRVIRFAQEPDFRLFWRGTAPIFLNAVLYGRSLTE